MNDNSQRYERVDTLQQGIESDSEGPPGMRYLTRGVEVVIANKCDCPSGQGHWGVEWKGVFYAITPGTQMQKDNWLGCKGASIDLLRWYCYNCATVQLP